MRLFLSSYRLGEQVRALAELAGSGSRVAVVANALDNLPDFPRSRWLEEQYDALAGAGLAWRELDLRDHYREPQHLQGALAEVDMVWATGGNSFVLRDVSIAPHYRSEHPESEAVERVVEYFRVNGMPYRALRDGQAIVVSDGSLRILEV